MSQGDNERKYGSRLLLRIFVPWMGPVGHQVPGTMLRAYLDSTPSMKILLLSGCMITSCLPRSYLWKICYFPWLVECSVPLSSSRRRDETRGDHPLWLLASVRKYTSESTLVRMHGPLLIPRSSRLLTNAAIGCSREISETAGSGVRSRSLLDACVCLAADPCWPMRLPVTV